MLRGHLIGSVQVCSCCPGIVSYPTPLVGWPLLYIQRQLGSPVRYPDLVTAYSEGAVCEHRRLLSGYDAVLRAVVLVLRRAFRDRYPQLTHQHETNLTAPSWRGPAQPASLRVSLPAPAASFSIYLITPNYLYLISFSSSPLRQGPWGRKEGSARRSIANVIAVAGKSLERFYSIRCSMAGKSNSRRSGSGPSRIGTVTIHQDHPFPRSPSPSSSSSSLSCGWQGSIRIATAAIGQHCEFSHRLLSF